MKRLAHLLLAVGLLSPAATFAARAQRTGDDALSQRDVDRLRDAAFTPVDRLRVFVDILNERQRRIDDLLARRRTHTDFPGEMHDQLDQFGKIVDELNDNLDDYTRRHRDVRKALPKLVEATDRWSTTLRNTGENEAFQVVERIVRDDVKDTRELAVSLQAELDAYFKAHPEAEAREKQRAADPHAVEAPER